jgi:hypothetical protein
MIIRRRFMTRKTYLKNTLIMCLFFLAFGGWLLHTRIHAPMAQDENLIPFISGLFSVFILPFLFWYKPTLIFAYIANGFLIIIATITMGHFSIAHFHGPVTLYSLLFNTLLADISIAWAKFVVGKAIFDLEFVHTENDPLPKGRWLRYPNTGWWLVHLVGLSFVYALGNILWR